MNSPKDVVNRLLENGVDPAQKFTACLNYTAQEIAQEISDMTEIPVDQILSKLTPEICQAYVDVVFDGSQSDAAADAAAEHARYYIDDVLKELGLSESDSK